VPDADGQRPDQADRESKVAHHGKTVLARLSVRLDWALAGQQLRADVAAMNRSGKTQLEPGTSTITVK